MKQLDRSLYPEINLFEFPVDSGLIDAVYDELSSKAAQDHHQCMGYFPGIIGKNIDADFDKTKKFEAEIPSITVNGVKQELNFVRLSLARQAGTFDYHIDSSAAGASYTDPYNFVGKTIWRTIINLGQRPRVVGYLDIDPSSVVLKREGQLQGYNADSVDDELCKEITLPPRSLAVASGVTFMSDRVLHVGRDDANGHFIAAYGAEVVD